MLTGTHVAHVGRMKIIALALILTSSMVGIAGAGRSFGGRSSKFGSQYAARRQAILQREHAVSPSRTHLLVGSLLPRVGNLGGNGKRSGALEARLGSDFGAGAWEVQVRANAAALGGGSGWVVLALSMHDGGLRISQSTNHTQALAFGGPLLVLDMYEHAYAIDFGADHAAYLEAFFKNIAWDAVEARYDHAMKAMAALG